MCGTPLQRSEEVAPEHHSNDKGKLEMLYKSLRDEVLSAIAKERDVIDDYAELENKLRENGLTHDADTVNEIRNDEMDHRIKFQVMLDVLQARAQTEERIRKILQG